MIRRIVLENFMSHRRTVIEPAEGLTVLVGPNNCGKSAVVVALQCLNTCDSRSAPFIRHDQKEARVIVETDEGSRIEWIRGKNYTNYKIDGREMTRARRPEDLDEHLKLAQVESEDGKRSFDLHFAEQKNPIFLLNESGAAAATFFAASSDAAYLVQMQSLLKRKESEARSRKRDLDARIDRQRRQLQAFEPLTEIESAVKAAQDTYAELSRRREEIAALQRLRFSLEEAGLEVEASQADLHALAPTSAPPVLEPTDELNRFVRTGEGLTSRVGAGSARTSALRDLAAPPTIEDSYSLATAIELLARRQKNFGKLSEKTAISAEAEKPPEMEDPSALQRIVSELTLRLDLVSKARTVVDSVDLEREAAKAALLEYVEENPSCPVCGSILSADRILTEVS